MCKVFVLLYVQCNCALGKFVINIWESPWIIFIMETKLEIILISNFVQNLCIC